jgi:hypothetical protein
VVPVDAGAPVVPVVVDVAAPVVAAVAPLGQAVVDGFPVADVAGVLAALRNVAPVPFGPAVDLAAGQAVDRALLGLGAGSSAVATPSRLGSDTPTPAPTAPLAHAPVVPADAGGPSSGNAGGHSGAGQPAAVLAELLTGLLLCGALCRATRTRRLTWWFPEVVVGPG